MAPGHILMCENASIHLTEENKSLVEILWERENILLLYLPSQSPELNPIEIVFQLLGARLCNSNARYKSRDIINNDFIMLKCIEVLESITKNDDIRNNYKKCRYSIEKKILMTFHLLSEFFYRILVQYEP